MVKQCTRGGPASIRMQKEECTGLSPRLAFGVHPGVTCAYAAGQLSYGSMDLMPQFSSACFHLFGRNQFLH